MPLVSEDKKCLFFLKSSEADSLHPAPAQAHCSNCQKVRVSWEAPQVSFSQQRTPVLQLGLRKQVPLGGKHAGLSPPRTRLCVLVWVGRQINKYATT